MLPVDGEADDLIFRVKPAVGLGCGDELRGEDGGDAVLGEQRNDAQVTADRVAPAAVSSGTPGSGPSARRKPSPDSVKAALVPETVTVSAKSPARLATKTPNTSSNAAIRKIGITERTCVTNWPIRAPRLAVLRG